MSSEDIETLQNEIQVCFLLKKNEDNSDDKNHRGVLTLFLLIMQIIFTVIYCYPFSFGIIKKELVFQDLSYVLRHRQDIFFSFLAYQTLRAIVRLFSQFLFN